LVSLFNPKIPIIDDSVNAEFAKFLIRGQKVQSTLTDKYSQFSEGTFNIDYTCRERTYWTANRSV